MKDFIQLKGELFERVQMEEVFPDSKTFVDSYPLKKPEVTLEEYNKRKGDKTFNLKRFISDNFGISKVTGGDLKLKENRTMEEHISILWDVLLRKPDDKESEYTTLLPLPYSYIVPGGRFTEIYYWDSYFTAEGLVAYGKIEIVENMVKNFAYLIDKYGHIPNGNRVYYLSRSQPPFFCSMVYLLYKNKGLDSVKPYLSSLEKEYSYWMEGSRAVEINRVKLNRYWDDNPAPREESFREDFNLCRKTKPANESDFYRNIRAAAESGWDFSSRWFKDEINLSSIRTTEILPVDLNCIMYDFEVKLGELFSLAGEKTKSEFYKKQAQKRKEAIEQIFWGSKEGFYFDYCFTEEKKTLTWSLAGIYPLFVKTADEERAKTVSEKLKNKFLVGGGLVTTLNKTSQQWDYPNGWAPLQWIGYNAMKNYGYNQISGEIAKSFINMVRNVFNRTGKMMEKYNVCDLSLEAGGGEYALQDGFGWTNGVVSALMAKQKI